MFASWVVLICIPASGFIVLQKYVFANLFNVCGRRRSFESINDHVMKYYANIQVSYTCNYIILLINSILYDMENNVLRM